MYPFILTPSLLATVMVVASKCMGKNSIFSSFGIDDGSKSTDDELKNVNMDELAEKLVQEIKRQSPEVVKAIENIGKEGMTSGITDSIYLRQIAAAQEFLNENHNADLSRIQRVLQKMLPERYYGTIARLKEHQDPGIIYNFYGGQHLHAPNATKAEQNFEEKSNLGSKAK